MGLRSLFPSAAEDAATTSQPYCHCHMAAATGDAANESSIRPSHFILGPPSPSSTTTPPQNPCLCGEWRHPQLAWKWDTARQHPEVRIDPDDDTTPATQRHRVIFHPTYSAGTAVVRSDRPLVAGEINYFEVKVLTPMTGTDMMIGIGTERVPLIPATHQFVSHLGIDDQSWGYSYRGIVQHNGVQRPYGRRRFSIGCIVGVLADLRHGRIEFYLNRRPLGCAYHNVPAGVAGHPLYAYACSTAAKSAIRLIHASHHAASLQFMCFRQLARCPRTVYQVRRVPGMRYLCAELFYLHAKEQYAYEEFPAAAATATGGDVRATLDEEALLGVQSRAAAAKGRLRPAGFLDDELMALEGGDTTTATQDDDGELDIYADLIDDHVDDEDFEEDCVYRYASDAATDLDNAGRELPKMVCSGLM